MNRVLNKVLQSHPVYSRGAHGPVFGRPTGQEEVARVDQKRWKKVEKVKKVKIFLLFLSKLNIFGILI